MVNKVCTRCYHTGEPKKVSSPVGLVFAVIGVALLFMPMPMMYIAVGGVIALMLMLIALTAGHKQVCSKCQSDELVPYSSDRGKQLLAQHNPAGFLPGDAVPLAAAPVPPPIADDSYPCPVCAETIKRAAIKCRFCGESFGPAPM